MSGATDVRKIRAGGGVLTRVTAAGPRILLIRRRGLWDLPKGKLDVGETIEDCARREVREELGIDDVRIVDSLGTTEHEYEEAGTRIAKTTWWYLMRTDADRFVPQVGERIDAVDWVHPDEAIDRLAFDTLRNLVREHRGRLVRETP